MRSTMFRVIRPSLSIGAAAIALASVLSISSADAATSFALTSGGTSFNLNTAFNPDAPGLFSCNGGYCFTYGTDPTIGTGTAVTVFDSTSPSLSGLVTSPTAAAVMLTFTYMGSEAGNTNGAYDALSYGGTPIFQNHGVSTPGSSTALLSVNTGSSGLIPIAFNSIVPASSTGAINGGPISSNVAIAFDIVSSTVAYVFFEDIYQLADGSDRDFDDMVVRIQLSDASTGLPGTPLPAAFPLFASGLGALGLLGWRRKRKNAAAIAAA